MAQVVGIGQPVNEVERLAIAHLRDELPDEYVVVHNVELGERGRAPYEYDVVVIGEHAVYALEVKGYFGKVTGNKRDWYVRGRHRRSPLPLAFQKARVLSGQLRRAKGQLNQVWVEAVVFLANPKVEANFPPDVAEHVRTTDDIVDALLDPDAIHRPKWPIKPTTEWTKTIKRVLLGGRPSPGRTHVGPYRLLGQIAQTEFFTDHEAVNEALVGVDASGSEAGAGDANGPIVRLRLFPVDPYSSPEDVEKQRQRGIWEASVLRWLGDHPGLVSAGDPFFPDADDLAVALPFEQAAGITLRSHIEREGPLPAERLLAAFEPALQALALAHSRGIVHRRITPDAFLYEPGQPLRLADFAFSARAMSGGPVDTALLHPRYSAPELFAGEPATPAADLYSVGAVLTLALTGDQPRSKSNVGDGALGEHAAAAVSALDEPLSGVIAGLLSESPSDRPTDGYALLESLVPQGVAQTVATHGGEVMLGDGLVANDVYRVVRRLGPPRTRTTYEVEHLGALQRRALRVVEADQGLIDQMRHAFRSLYELRHPALLRVNELDRLRAPEVPAIDGASLYLIDLEFSHGEPLAALIAGGGVGLKRACELTLQVVDVIAYLDDCGVHHGGLGAETIFVSSDGDVRVSPPASVWPRTALSPPALRYLSPTSPPSLREDLAAAGIVLWELATGRHPFAGGVREPGARLALGISDEPRATATAEQRCLWELGRGLTPFLEQRKKYAPGHERFTEIVETALALCGSG